MSENIKLDDWMWQNKMTNTTMAKAISDSGYFVTHSTISQIRNKKARPSPGLALAIFEFVGESVSLKEILSAENKP